MRSTRPHRVTIAFFALAGLLLALCATAYVDTRRPRIVTYEVPVDGIAREVDMLFCSDLHGARFGAGQARIASLLGESRFDLIVLGGDMVGTRSRNSIAGPFAFAGASMSPDPAYDLLGILSSRTSRPVLFVRGNHDGDEVLDGLALRGAEELSSLTLEDAGLNVVTDPLATQEPGSQPCVLVTHIPPTPGHMQWLAEQNVAVVIAGHTHGGQIAVPLIGPIWAPLPADQLNGWFPGVRGAQTHGVRDYDGVHAVISRGLGTIDIPLRFFSRAELTHIRFVPE